MDVHHHAHTERKKWHHYFWEFFMLFLAVTLGFFVENMREHYMEHQREIKLARSLYKDIQSDTAHLNAIIYFRKIRRDELDSLLELLQQLPATNNAIKIYQLSRKSILHSNTKFTRTAGTISQLKNSGFLRYFDGTSVPAKLAEYETSLNALQEFEDLEFNEITDRYVPYLWQHFEANAIDTLWYQQKQLFHSPKFIDMTENNINDLKSLVISLKLINTNAEKNLISAALKIATSFLDSLKKEYHLK